ncbi:26S proteasome non-ATPase regulatory subunit 10 [Buteo buteo]|uniref:26S proteasome non-ATPase regulatory subunit 10 n=1 Tax=Buteo buteo TaxID=30397 RepID=UPI003EB7688E
MEDAVSDVGICNLAYAGRLEELRAQLLRDRALATKADQDNRTALHWACSAGHTDVADLLLGLGVPVNDKDDVSVAAIPGHPRYPREGPARGSGRLGKCCEPVRVGNLVAQFLSGAFAVTVSAAEVPLASGPVATGAGRFLLSLLPSVGVSGVVSGRFQKAHAAVCVLGRQAEVFRCLCGRGGNETWMSPAYCQGSLGELFLQTKLQNQGFLGCSGGFSCYLYLGVILLNML